MDHFPKTGGRSVESMPCYGRDFPFRMTAPASGGSVSMSHRRPNPAQSAVAALPFTLCAGAGLILLVRFEGSPVSRIL